MRVTVPDSTACSNCGATLSGRFCASCGQEVLPLSPRLRDVVRDFTHDLFDVDGRTARSFRTLFLQPGRLTREQFDGRRVRWLSPTKLYLIFSVACFALVAVAGTNVRVHVNGTKVDAEDTAGIQRLGYKDEAEMRQTLGRAQAVWMPRVMFVLVPALAGLVQLARRRSGRTFPQHLQFALHLHAVGFALGALVTAATLARWPIVAQVVRPIVVVYAAIYAVLAFRTAYGGTTRRAVLHAALVLPVYFLLVLLATLAIILPLLIPPKG